ncbi:1757_t:CDS:1, partial [Dentiscutata erythropus]
ASHFDHPSHEYFDHAQQVHGLIHKKLLQDHQVHLLAILENWPVEYTNLQVRNCHLLEPIFEDLLAFYSYRGLYCHWGYHSHWGLIVVIVTGGFVCTKKSTLEKCIN